MCDDMVECGLISERYSSIVFMVVPVLWIIGGHGDGGVWTGGVRSL